MTVKNKVKTSLRTDARTFDSNDKTQKSEARLLTEGQLCPIIFNTMTVKSFSNFSGEIDLTEAFEIMSEKSKKIINGDLSDLESTLSAQVVSLNAIFNTLARRAATNEYLKQMEVHMRLALKAQAQCIRTVEVLAAIKNPPIIFAKQANISQGHQQINNNPSISHAGKNINSKNELLSEDHNETLDTRGTIETINVDKEVATVETVNGSEDTRR